MEVKDQDLVSLLMRAWLIDDPVGVPVTDSAACAFSQMFHCKWQPGNSNTNVLCWKPFGVWSVKLCGYTLLCQAVLWRWTRSWFNSVRIFHLFIYFKVFVCRCGVGGVIRGDLRHSSNVLIAQKVKWSLEEVKGHSQSHLPSWGRVGAGNLA